MALMLAEAAAVAEEIPILDLGPYLGGQPGALERLAGELRHAFEHIGFYFIRNHGVPRDLCDAVFVEAARFHAQPDEAKVALKINEHNIGYLPFRAATTRHSTLNIGNKPNLNEAFFVKRELPPDHPDIIANKRFRGRNQWPADLPGFRETVILYCDAMAPHTDTSFMTLLAQNRIPGLAIRLPSGKWIDAPALPDTFLVNGGDMLRRWTNHRFLATPHRVINRSGRERYAIPFFFDCTIDNVMACLPTCTDAANPPRHEPFTYSDYMAWYQKQNYDHARTDNQLAGA
jgi:isopenicillin N synthase-like dioxygenase